MRKASSKTSFGLNKFYLRITSSLQILTLLSFIFRFSKLNWKTTIEIISFYGDLKILIFCWIIDEYEQPVDNTQDTPFLKWSKNTEFSVLQLVVCDINFQWHCLSGWIKYCWMLAVSWTTLRCASHKIMKQRFDFQWDRISCWAEWNLI